jgi:hypothetical protein
MRRTTWREVLAGAYSLAAIALVTVMGELDVREWIIWCTAVPVALGVVLIWGWKFSKEP